MHCNHSPFIKTIVTTWQQLGFNSLCVAMRALWDPWVILSVTFPCRDRDVEETFWEHGLYINNDYTPGWRSCEGPQADEMKLCWSSTPGHENLECGRENRRTWDQSVSVGRPHPGVEFFVHYNCSMRQLTWCAGSCVSGVIKRVGRNKTRGNSRNIISRQRIQVSYEIWVHLGRQTRRCSYC